jgi:acetyl esterase
MILDPSIQKLLDELAAEGGPPVYTLTPREARESLLHIQRGSFSALCFLSSTARDLNVEFAGQSLRFRIVRPIGASERRPVVMYFHGGGWVLGDRTTHDRLVRELAVGSDAVVVFVEYDRAPEKHYPIQLKQCYAATLYVAENAEALDADSSRIAIAGDSAGGNIAAATCLIAKQRNEPKILGQLLLYPVTSSCLDDNSFVQFENGPWLTKKAMKWFWEQYVPNPERRNQSHASPLLATRDELAGLPRTLLITSENDVLRDQGEEYGRKLLAAGVDVVTTRYIGTIHDFLMLNALAESPTARAAITQATHFLKSVLLPIAT